MSATVFEKVSNFSQFRRLLRVYRTNTNFISKYSSFLSPQDSSLKRKSAQEPDDEFRTYEIPGAKPQERMKRRQRKRAEVPPDRSLRMQVDQDWTKAWPTNSTFKQSVVPFPVRQGFVEKTDENEGVVPGKYGNAELMKIPNFLHLSPAHVKKHCAAIKKFCTEWPEGLETDESCDKHFPITVTTSDYCKSGPSERDFRARVAKIKFKLSSLELDYHARDKFIRLVGDRYDKQSGMVTIESDRCPLKQQNYDYCMYLLTALYYESWKIEPWELEKSEVDMEQYFWDISQSRQSAVNLVRTIKEITTKQMETSTSTDGAVVPSTPGYLATLSHDAEEEAIVKLGPIQNYKHAVNSLHNEGESQLTVEQYKESVRQLLNLKAS